MTDNSTWHSPEALQWLQLILQERFGHAFTLRIHSCDTLSCSLNGDARAILLTLQGTTFKRADSDLAHTQWDATSEGWHSPLGVLPAPGLSALPPTLIEPTSQGYRIHYDIFGLTYWMLTRQEEVARTDLDEHRRFPASSSHAYRHGYLERPIVDEWLQVLGQVISRTWPELTLAEQAFSQQVSHDVDMPSRYGFRSWKGMIRAAGGDLLKRGDIYGTFRAPWIRLNTRTRLHPKDPANTFDWIMDVSEQLGLISAFYFICGRTDPTRDADYEPEHEAIRSLMRQIHRRGHEIGLHPSYQSYLHADIIRSEAQRLRKIAAEEDISQPQWGGRMHYLRWSQPITLKAWADAGMNYDSTLSYADRPGFRCGTCFEYPAFDPVACTALSLRIRPLIAMECSVMDPAYLGLGTGDAALAKFQQLKNACRAVNGCFTLLWHNSRFDTDAEKKLYQTVLQ